MAWKIEPTSKKCIVDVEFYEKRLKNGKSITFSKEVGYRWGHVIVDEDPTDAIKEAQEKNEPVNVSMLGILDHSYEDGCWSDNIGFEKLSKKEQKLLEESYWPDDAGWDCVENETYFHGDLEITEVEDKYPYTPIFKEEE